MEAGKNYNWFKDWIIKEGILALWLKQFLKWIK